MCGEKCEAEYPVDTWYFPTSNFMWSCYSQYSVSSTMASLVLLGRLFTKPRMSSFTKAESERI